MSSQGSAGGVSGKKRANANFMRQFRDSTTKELKKLTSVQFMEVWNHYDKDGEFLIQLNSSELFVTRQMLPHKNKCTQRSLNRVLRVQLMMTSVRLV